MPRFVLCLTPALAATLVALVLAEETKSPAPSSIVATIDNDQVTSAEVEREVQAALRGRKLEGAALEAFRKQALEQVIDRRLVLRYLQNTSLAASKDDVELALARLVRQLKARDTKLADHLKSIGMTEAELRQELLWKISWKRYADSRATDENLQKYFEKHRRSFDGTELKVAHILFKVENAQDSRAIETTLKRAASLREEIVRGKIAFAEAAKKHSQAPTAKDGGQIGTIRRHEPMPDEFSLAAFALEKGDLSQPVVTAFGVHLIQVLEIVPGQRNWQDCREELRPAVTLYLFRWIADKERKTAKLAYVAGPQP